MGVGKQGRDATLANALSGCETFGVDKESAKAIVRSIQATAKTWQGVYASKGVSQKDIAYFSEANTFKACEDVF